MNNLYVHSLAWATTDESLKALFETVCTVTSAKVIMDKMSGRSKGFGFVEVANDAEANLAIEKLNGAMLDGREIRVAHARPKEERA